MIRATTPKHSFIFDIDPEENFKKILITYSQNGNIIFEKTKEDLTFEQGVSCVGETEYIASFRLTQEETKMFTEEGRPTVKVQVRALSYSGEAFASDIKTLAVKSVLNDEVLV